MSGGRVGRNAQLIDDGAAQVIQRVHFQIHHGVYFTAGHLIQDVANTGHFYILIKVGPENTFHFSAQAVVEGKCYASIYENPSIDDDGTMVELHNRRRPEQGGAEKTTDTTIFHTPTIGSGGTGHQIEEPVLIPGGAGPQSVGAGARSGEEWVMAKNTNYLIDIQNVAGQAKDIYVGIGGYSEDD